MDFNGILALIIIFALTIGLVFRQLTECKRSDSESTSRTDDMSGEENEAYSESTLSAENASGDEYDVFLSFRGSDTRLNFTDYLYCSMVRAGIRVFLDSEELEVGKEIREVMNALNKSRIYIPIFSQKFASSIWCLREVERMVKCYLNSIGKKEIFPIFYDVTTDDVKLKTDLYKNAIIEHKEKAKPGEMEQWQDALKNIGNIIGLELQGKRQGLQIESIVQEVSRKFNAIHMIETENLVEDSAQVEVIMKLLDVDFDGVRFVGIHGIGGIGKTTLAKVIFNKLFFHFEGCCFLEDVRASSQTHDGLLELQKKLLLGFVSSEIINQIRSVAGGIKMIKNVFSNKKVLIVLDDLDKKEQLQNLAGKSNWFCSGSRIIITTRDESILNTQVDSKGILPHEVVGMRSDLALRLFYKHAFRSDSVVKGYEDFSKNIVCKVGMLPLAIVVIGAHVFDLGNHLRNSDKRKIWDETLEKLEDGLFKDVRDSLMISYEQLEDIEKKVFLDIACFFSNEDITYPIIMWKDCGYWPHTAIGVLSHRSFIKIRDDNRFWMHDQIRDFGRDIIVQEYPHKIRRVWNHVKALNLLKAEKRNEDVEALSLISHGHNFTREELACLPKLRFLRVKRSDFSGNFENLLSELRWLSWETWQTTFHANNFHFSNLVVLDLLDSSIEDGWVGWSQMKMDRLKVLDLTGCVRLKKTPDFSNFMFLEKLILARCVKLTTIDSSIGKLKHLTTLNIKGCRLLKELPKEVGALQSLTEVFMPQTFQPFNLPETFGNLESLSSLILDRHLGISQLPSYIGGLLKVTRLSLHWCVGIENLPCSLGKMEMLVELNLSMSGIVELPNSIKYLKKLKVIRVSYTMIRKFPHTIGQVEMLEELHAKKCWDLTDENLEEIGKLSHLKILDLSYTNISKFPTVLGCLSCLQTLGLGSSDLQEVPKLPSSLTHLHMQARQFPSIPSLSSLVNLDYLKLSRLTVSREEPNPSWWNNSLKKLPIHSLPCGLSTLKCRGLELLPPPSKLTKLSVMCVIEYPMPFFRISEELSNLTELKLSKCNLVWEIHGSSRLKNLQRLDLNRLDGLVEIQGLSELESLLYFRICDCDKIEKLPNLSKLDKLQHIELEACPKIKAIEGITGLESLKLDNRGCTILERLLDVSGSTWLSRKAIECQVFLSFSGIDTSYSIVDILYKNLVRNQISVFMDDDILSSCDGIGERLPQALNDSLIYIPFLSKNYASSWECLRELAHMVECTSNSYGKKKILPIFCDVKVHDFRRESTFYRSLDEHRWKFGMEVEEWKMALRKVADLGGFNFNSNSHGEVIELIVKEVSCRLNNRHAEVPEYLVEDHRQVKAIIEKLDVDSSGVRFVGIHGMDGIGKTTLAKVVFSKLLLQFDSVSFLENVRESSQNGLNGLVSLQKKLLSSVIGFRDTVHIKDIGDGMDQIKRACHTNKVLIVLDDLDNKEQLEKLAGKSDWFGPGSRILITTRDKSILESSSEVVLNQPEGILTYEVHEMQYGQALELFNKLAFKRNSPAEGYDHVITAIDFTMGMLPRAVVEIGSIFSHHRIGEWRDELEKLYKGPLKVVRDALMISYEQLKDEEKEIFLDIACFFTNQDLTYPVIMWDDYNYHPDSAIRVLLQRSLIKIRDNKLWMHNQLRGLARNIILEEYPHKVSRVWIRDGEELLWSKERNQDVEALSLTSRDVIFTAKELAALPKLRFLQVEGLGFSGDLKNLLPELRWLSWEIGELPLQAKNFHFSNLVVLDLSDSDIEDGWSGWSQMKMNRLKVLDLTGCRKLTRTPDFSNFLTLEMLILAWCRNLTTIDNSISKLTVLSTLNIKGCLRIKKLPKEVLSLHSLTQVVMPYDFRTGN